MMPFFFGAPGRQLYGVYHAAAAAGRVGRGVVFCNPYGQEGIRCNRPYRVLADQLARQRWHVLRFDYSSSGDSFGEDSEARAAAWLDDIGAAIAELQAMTGVREVHLLGMRLGGLLAGITAVARRDVNGLVLWDPVLSGRSYLAEIVPGWRPDMPGDAAGEAYGFVVPAAFARDLAELRLDPARLAALPRLLVVASALTAESRPLARLANATTREVGGPLPWTKDNDFGAGPLPVAAMRTVVEFGTSA
jgi:pimeloyl-ACP methyl ester carboxylesterase